MRCGPRLPVVLAGAAWALAVFVFLKNAWVADDAWIVFRSLEQVFAGNGPVWNPHERVQAFTSPLWFGLLLVPRIVSADVYLNVIVVSFGLWLLTVRNLQRLAPSREAFVLGVLLCVASTAIFDYTTSGLENVLAYALISWFLLLLARLAREDLRPDAAVRAVFGLCLAFGLILVTRHDLVLLILPPAAFVLAGRRHLLSVRKRISLGLTALTPLGVWTLFSLFYYGFPLPNTAYAKLNTGIDATVLVAQGFRYLEAALRRDPMTLAVIAAGLALSQMSPRGSVWRFLGLGMVLNLGYVVWIGGDFMLGRFLSYSALAGVGLCVLRLPVVLPRCLARLRPGASPRTVADATALASAAALTFAVLYPHTPVNCWRPRVEHTQALFRVNRERDFYAELNLLNRYLRPAADGVRPNHPFARSGLDFRDSPDLARPFGPIGMSGYMAGTEKAIVDWNALADPLLARLPADRDNWFIGHFRRDLPAGYLDRVEAAVADFLANTDVTTERLDALSRSHPIEPPELNELHERLALVTQSSDLWSTERLETILRFNLGTYEHLSR